MVRRAATLGTRPPPSPSPCPVLPAPAPPSAPWDPCQAKCPLPGPCLRLSVLGVTPDVASNSGSNGGAQGMIGLRWVSREGFLGAVSSQRSFGGEECGLASQKKPCDLDWHRLGSGSREAGPGLRGPPRPGPSPPAPHRDGIYKRCGRPDENLAFQALLTVMREK